jgi:hypothetical protein
MSEIPEVILVPLTKIEALLVLKALSHHHETQQGDSDEQITMYSHVIDKITALLNADQSLPHIVR